jgi:hypothetical protein
MSEEKKNIFESEEWQRASKAFNEAIEHERQLSENFWNNLSSEEQLWVFCAIARRMSEAYLSENGTPSYRYFLYDVMDWGPEAYASAQCSGFLDIHNSIFTDGDLTEMVMGINKHLGVELDEEKVRDAIIKRRWY